MKHIISVIKLMTEMTIFLRCSKEGALERFKLREFMWFVKNYKNVTVWSRGKAILGLEKNL